MKQNILPFISTIAVLVLLAACAQPGPRELNEQIAQAYGIENFDKLRSLQFTFNIKKDTFQMARTWIWNPKENTVCLVKGSDTVHYKRDTIRSVAMKQLDQKFINDKYWLLFPFQLVWDRGCQFHLQEAKTMPIAKSMARCLTVNYNQTDGYTPKDAYDLFLDNHNMIREWTYRKGGADTATLSTTWEGVQDFKGIKIATTHSNADKTFKLWFSDIKVE